VADAFDHLIDPFWLSATMHRESVMFVESAGRTTSARLLFRPEEILAVQSASADISYVEGDDYQIDRQDARIVRAPGSRIPSIDVETIASADGSLTHHRTTVVTYAHADRWQRFVPAPAVTELPRVRRRLERREPLTICLCGDSIAEGYDASGFHHLRPYQPPFAMLVALGLQQRTGAKIQFHNFGTAGWTTADALWDSERITALHPDLVLVAFGMNDASYADAGEYAMNMSSLLGRVRADVPDTEFLLVSPMLPTPECRWLVHSRFAEYRDALATLTGEGVALADVTRLWTDLIVQKNPHDLSGNGLNHPNDFGHCMYAQTILAVLAS
jgi:lysophospholipase L1-like esterase